MTLETGSGIPGVVDQLVLHNVYDLQATVVSDFVLADISVRLPRKLFIFTTKDDVYRIKESKNYFTSFLKQKHWP